MPGKSRSRTKQTSITPRDRQRPGRAVAAVFVVMALLYLMVQLGAGPKKVHNDTYDYARITYGLLGKSSSSAKDAAVRMLCRDAAHRAEITRSMDPLLMTEPGAGATTQRRCIEDTDTVLAHRSPRYDAIFDARPGYPWVASLFARLLGVHLALWAASLVFTIASAAVVLLILARLGLSPGACLAGAALFLTLPTGAVSTEMLSEGAMLWGTLVVLLGSVALLQTRVRTGLLLASAGYAALFAIKSSQGLLLAVLETAAAVATFCWVTEARHRGVKWLATASACAAVSIASLTALMGAPGANESVQDTFTGHFQNPDVTDPWARLVTLNLHYWPVWLREQTTQPLFVISLCVAVGAMVVWRRRDALVVTAAALTGLATAASHPLATQVDRLMAPLWLLVVLGLPVAMHGITRRAPHPPSDGLPATSAVPRPSSETAGTAVAG